MTATQSSPVEAAGPVPAPYREPLPWGAGATFGLLVLSLGLALFVQLLVAAAAAPPVPPGRPAPPRLVQIAAVVLDGDVFATAALVSYACITGLLALAIWMRNASVREYIGLRLPGLRVTLRWLAALALLVVLIELGGYLLGRPPSPYVLKVYQSAEHKLWLAFAVLAGAPFAEELLFRGFALPGLRRSWLGAPGAIVLTAVLWAALHAIYGAYETAGIAAVGILFGAARLRTGSTALTMVMHFALNLLATVQVVAGAG